MNNSMINPSIVELLEKVDNRYSLVVMASKRARQLISNEEPLIETELKKPVTVAINEIHSGAITYETLKEGIK
ncbi:DNA-directed RNA polymerase subunit omega [Clostridium sp. MSJ-11]|uniref:DNA-directed RNA polymerase subunit omega n=1 Tax=Clostridium mobile TaxID=2841512 RepID=A0ABS6ED42_9CLOT|nr:DNA-directed RNA polymerase subunit omega [Clostridium mobile]MBU5482722.1 DNA-directed RNA polymerase subunit omega [Clostridium mobile]